MIGFDRFDRISRALSSFVGKKMVINNIQAAFTFFLHFTLYLYSNGASFPGPSYRPENEVVSNAAFTWSPVNLPIKSWIFEVPTFSRQSRFKMLFILY